MKNLIKNILIWLLLLFIVVILIILHADSH